MSRNIRIGIDVGGTFTHAVALDGDTLEIAGKTKVPTTHRAAEGVAAGIIASLRLLLEETGIAAHDVGFIAHSTTQATNALLEGDVAPVGILGLGTGANAWLARSATAVGRIQLAPGKFLSTWHRFLDTGSKFSDAAIEEALADLVNKGARAVAISEAFSVDAPANEERAVELARRMGLPATCGSEVSSLYGLTVRTRTAVINAAMLPKMIESADMTERAVREAGIAAPIMIMRSDGGVMDIDSMRRRPILTMLSGPAAGVAAAMMYLHISDGIFLEVGGTSTDISAVRNGRAQVKSAEVGGHKVYMRTLDVRTVGVAGGSLPRLRDGAVTEVGPRSAHIAGLAYAAFQESVSDPSLATIRPAPSDPDDYVAFAGAGQPPSLALTPTCAANLLEIVPCGDPAYGNREPVYRCFCALAEKLNVTPADAAERMLTLATDKCLPVVEGLLKDYKLDRSLVTLVGGGGGAAALVPFLAGRLDLRHSLARNADVISAIGVALALVRETVERQIVAPDSDDILRVRQEARSAVERMGADPSTIEIHVEVDSRANIVRATASGATAMTSDGRAKEPPGDEEKKKLAADSMRVPVEDVELAAATDSFQVWQARTSEPHLFGLLHTSAQSLRVVDVSGVVRLQVRNGMAVGSEAASAERTIADLAEDHSSYGDAGRIVPPMMLLAGAKIVDLSGLMDLTQMLALAKIELESLPRSEPVVVIAQLS